MEKKTQLYGYFKRQIDEILHDMDIGNLKKGKPKERNWISLNCRTKQSDKKQLYESENG